MKPQVFRNILYLIGATLLLVLSAQVYRVWDTYQVNKLRFINDVQNALDIAVESYYANQAKEQIMIFQYGEEDTIAGRFPSSFTTTATVTIDTTSQIRRSLKRINWDTSHNSHGFSYSYSFKTDGDSTDSPSVVLDRLGIQHQGTSSFSFDTLRIKPSTTERFAQLAEKVMISFAEDRLDLEELEKYVNEELERKELPIAFQLQHAVNGKVFVQHSIRQDLPLVTDAKTTYLSDSESIKMSFENGSMLILRRGVFDLVVSLVVVLAVLGALIYMYRIITEQKQLAQIKDELISNITHEFKTPIATISTAIEGISSFNETNDREKTKRYLSISDGQLKKLNMMVEKLLETATIDSGELQIEKEEVDLRLLTKKVVENFQLVAADKKVALEIPEEAAWYAVDPFHLENAISNLIDNAIKYGGNHIQVHFSVKSDRPVWSVSDDGGNLPNTEKDRVFEKLYRISTGNRHDVKGFGIGLYYTKAIVEKHGGHIEVKTGNELTTFTISL